MHLTQTVQKVFKYSKTKTTREICANYSTVLTSTTLSTLLAILRDSTMWLVLCYSLKNFTIVIWRNKSGKTLSSLRGAPCHHQELASRF